VTTSAGLVRLPADTVSVQAALHIADERMYAEKSSGRPSPSAQSRDVLLRVLRERHPDLGHDTAALVRLASDDRIRMGLEPMEVEQVRNAAKLYDIGKVAIPDRILAKAGGLDEAEWAFVHRHPLIGERIIRAAPSLAPVARIVRSSHERWDGQGYPDRLGGRQIPIGARIVAACGAYDALVSARSYRPERGGEEALAELRRCSGTQFDPAVVTALEAVVAGGQSLRLTA
jgi:two-component system cell cycle response regulator